jgi:dTMP kinase
MGKLICLSGLDASGKSTQIDLIKKYFEENNIKYTYLHFPIYEDNEAGKIISSYLRGEYGDINEVDPIFVANIYAMNRYLYLPELNKQLLDNDVVLLDRYVFCNMAYQGAKYDTDAQSQIMRDWINEFEFGFLELPYPDLNIFIDTPLDLIESRLSDKREGKDRRYLNGRSDIHEMNIEFQKKVRENYLWLNTYENYLIVSPEKLTPEEIFKKYEKDLFRALLIK